MSSLSSAPDEYDGPVRQQLDRIDGAGAGAGSAEREEGGGGGSSADGRRRLKTVNFLSALNRDGHVRDYRLVDNDRLEERCYFSCSLPGPSGHAASRGRPREPDCLALCYIRFKDAMHEIDEAGKRSSKASLRASNNMTEDLERAFRGSFPSSPPTPEDIKGKGREDARYRLGALEGKYIYKARGRLAIAKHAEAEVTPEAVLEMERQQELNPPGKMITRAERLGLARKTPVLSPPSYEILYPLCTSISSRMHRFEKHLVRIYGPTYRALQRMPEMWMDGTQARLAGQIYERALSGDGLVLGQRLLESSWTMLKKWKESLGSGGGTEGNEGGGVGGTHPSAGQHKGGNGVDSQNGVPGRGPPPGFGPPPVEPPPPAA